MEPFTLTPPPPDSIPRYGPLCCEDCFDDIWLHRFIKRHSKQTGLCDFCETDNVALLEVSALSVPFLNLMTMYSPVGWDNTNLHIDDPIDAGEMLDVLIQEDWEIFSDRLLAIDRSMDLIEAILDAQYTEAEWHRRYKEDFKFDRMEVYTSRQDPSDYRLIDDWNEHKEKILVSRGTTRSFGLSRSSFERISVTLPKGSLIYRARAGYETTGKRKQSYEGAAIGAPPSAKASAGRANRSGESVLYCADQEATAVAEVRPARGFYVSLARFQVTRELQVVDLVRNPCSINPFTDSDLPTLVDTNALFRDFARDLQTPLRRDDDVRTYLPSQSITQTIRRAKFDGIRYPSAMNTGGSNIVLFDTSSAGFMDSRLVEIMNVLVEFDDIDRT